MKRIILLSDGTGNSSASLFKTNVWRLYQSLDLDRTNQDTQQIACYNDGVGTSTFKPLALLGGVFGYGLKRNVLHLYTFACQHWEEGDEIFIFGFSRGAFTVRILAGLIADQGLLLKQDDATLAYATHDIYRQYRTKKTVTISFPQLFQLFRWLRDRVIHVRRRLGHQIEYKRCQQTEGPKIKFLGVWDTVAAYGSPFAELTRGIDKFVFPLSIPDRKLRPEVLHARHALALDDERDTFHPLLWDEQDLKDAKGCQDTERLKQVWFAGMHADVGGGYPDDSLSFHPLNWMMQEANKACLRFIEDAQKRFAPPPAQSAPMHNSRKGIAGYYRYQPRRLSAYDDPPDPETVVMVDPSLKAKVAIPMIHLHHSVIDRIQSSSEQYAPIVLPETFEVVQPDRRIIKSPETPEQAKQRIDAQARIWDLVWLKRFSYFAMVAVSLVLGSMPLWPAQTLACEALACAISPVIRAVGTFLPGFAGYWTDAWAGRPLTTILLLGGFVALQLIGAGLKQKQHDEMWALWGHLRKEHPATRHPRGDKWWIRVLTAVRTIRTSKIYLDAVRSLKWNVLPTVLGALVLFTVLVTPPLLIAVFVVRQYIAWEESSGRICEIGSSEPDGDRFLTSMPCWKYTGGSVHAGRSYLVQLTIDEPWLDSTIVTGPQGFDPSLLPWLSGYWAVVARRSASGRWFQPFVTIKSADGTRHVQPLEFQPEGDKYVARLVAAADGTVIMWVNDVARHFAYANNHGSAHLRFTEQP